MSAAAVERVYVNEERMLVQRTSAGQTIARYVVKAFSIAGTNMVVFQAYEPTEHPWQDFTAAFHSDRYGYLGLYTSRALPPEIESLAYGEERSRAVTEHLTIRKGDACDLIAAAFPELGGCWEPDLAAGEMVCELAEFHARVTEAAS